MLIGAKGVSKGVVIAPLKHYTRVQLVEEKKEITDINQEIARFENARALAATQLGNMAVELGATLGEQNSLLFEIHKMMLEDLDYKQSVIDLIEQQSVSAEYAVSETARKFAKMFSEMDDEYMQARATDVQDVSRRVLEIFQGKKLTDTVFDQPVILVSDDFAPSETAQFNRAFVQGLITTKGSVNSHTAIFARTIGIPAVIDADEAVLKEKNGSILVMDGETGEVHVNPELVTRQLFEQKRAALQQKQQLLEKYRGVKTKTKTGQIMKLFANVGNISDVKLAVEQDAEGIGLFRSEFLYLEKTSYPTEEEQYKVYRMAAEEMEGKQVIIRTLDIGADKQVSYFQLEHEENPAMGMRAIRICLTRQEIFKTQLKALLRAAIYGNIMIMLPMITSVEEVRQAKEIFEQAKQELRTDGILYQEEVPIGIMIETPAAAVISDLLAKEVDFFSIGTNDLTQYTLAVDRMNPTVASFCDEHHPAILRLIELVVKNAHDAGIWVGICGELGADLRLTEQFLKIGVDELSVTPSTILALREVINNKD